jgi:hypothetical protein
MLSDIQAYERFVYGLPETFPSIRRSTLVVIRRGPTIAELKGEIEFDRGIVLGVWEDLNFARRVIQAYSYWVEQEGKRLYWYDPQPHPDDSSLASTFPHHKHVPPDIKRHRAPATGLTFDQPNLSLLIQQIERELLSR